MSTYVLNLRLQSHCDIKGLEYGKINTITFWISWKRFFLIISWRKSQNFFKVRTGEILVVPKTDPGWTLVFAKIGGLITETGGILSHGAVVSREYGIPSVTNIVEACKIFKIGMTVKSNGTKGIDSILTS